MSPEPANDSSVGELPASARRSKFLPFMAVALALVAVWYLSPRPVPRATTSPAVGQPAPTIDLVSLPEQGEPQPRHKLAGDKPTLLHFWGTWCPPCVAEYPELESMLSELQADGQVEFVSVSCEGGEETLASLTSKSHKFLRSAGAALEVYADPQGQTRLSLAQRLQQDSMFYPTSVLIDAQGTIQGVWQGYDPGNIDQMRQAISK